MKNMKKFFIASMLTALFISCPGFGGEEITSNDIKTAVLEALIAVDNDLTQKFGDAMYQKDYKLNPAGSSIMNVKYSSSCGLTVKERTAYEANLAGYELSPVQLLVDEKGTSADCSIIISGVLKGEISVSRWNSNQNNTAFYESSFENGDSDGLTLKVTNNDTGAIIVDQPVFIAVKAKASESTGIGGGNYKDECKINGDDFESDSVQKLLTGKSAGN